MVRIAKKLQSSQEECDHYKKSLIETQEKLLQTTNELQVSATNIYSDCPFSLITY